MQARTSRGGASAAGAAALLALWIAAPARAQQPPEPPSEAQATAALDAAEQALGEGSGHGGPGIPGGAAPEATVALNELAVSLPALDRRDRRRGHALLARPTDRNDRYGDSYPPGAPVASAASTHFCVFWINAPTFNDAPSLIDADGRSDGDGVPDYVESILGIAEYSYSVEVAPGALGWAPPKRDTQGCGSDPGDHTDVYLKELGALGLFGYESPDPGQGQRRSQYGYLVLDNDYSPQDYGHFADPLAPAKVTFAHEFNHLLQQNYDSFQDVWMFEATATWSEQQVYPEIDDYVNFVRSFAKQPTAPITDSRAGGGLKMYGAAVWNHWLTRRYGTTVVLRAWEVSDQSAPPDLATAAYDKAIRKLEGNGFSREFVRFTAATAEWRTGTGGFPDAASYEDMKRTGSLRRGRELHFKLDHTAFRLLDVRPAHKLRLKVRAEPGVRAGLALVAREGRETDGEVLRKSKYLGKDGRSAVTLTSAAGYERVTAIVVNADGRVRGFRGGDWVYGRDRERFDVEIAR